MSCRDRGNKVGRGKADEFLAHWGLDLCTLASSFDETCWRFLNDLTSPQSNTNKRTFQGWIKILFWTKLSLAYVFQCSSENTAPFIEFVTKRVARKKENYIHWVPPKYQTCNMFLLNHVQRSFLRSKLGIISSNIQGCRDEGHIQVPINTKLLDKCKYPSPSFFKKCLVVVNLLFPSIWLNLCKNDGASGSCICM